MKIKIWDSIFFCKKYLEDFSKYEDTTVK
jgi:hypothetical protein